MKQDKIRGLLLATVILFVFAFLLVRTGEVAYKYNEMNIQLQREINSNVEWLFRCDDYVSAFYNCPRELQFINMTGKYCNTTLTCKNEYRILKDKG